MGQILHPNARTTQKTRREIRDRSDRSGGGDHRIKDSR
jgi:hypothetical protein